MGLWENVIYYLETTMNDTTQHVTMIQSLLEETVLHPNILLY